MKSKKNSVLLLTVILFFSMCTEPIGIEGTDDSTGLLVVEGFISSELKKHSVRLTETARYGSIFEEGGFIEGQENAFVLVRNSIGQFFEFVDLGNGFYESSVPFAAEVGRSYSLLIELEDGREFLSLPVEVTPAVPIKTLAYEYSEILDVEKNETLTGFEIEVTLDDPADNDNFYLWQAQGLYELNTYPELHVVSIGGVLVPDPKECCETCWHTETFEFVQVGSDNLFNATETTRPAIYIEDNGLRYFYEKYMVRIKQYAINAEIFEFYTQVYSLIGLDGDIFDPPPSTLLGNIINTTDPNERAVGFFWAADVAMDSIFIDTNDLPEKKPQAIVKDDCREVPGTTIIEPLFWSTN